jgi:anti-anti-sigma factor
VDISLAQQKGFTLATTGGPLDDSTTAAFREHLHPLFNTRGTKLIVDIAGSPRVTSEGLTAMVRLVSDANTRDGRVVFAGPTAFVSEVFRVTRLEKFFEVAATVDEAARGLA